MVASGTTTLPTIGFLTVLEDAQWGLTGGLLILNVAGRPVEFHCTAPLKPNRAQEILYGPTLRPFLYGEQIGQTLISKVKSETLFVCTDVEPAMCVRETLSLPVVLIREHIESRPLATSGALGDNELRIDQPHSIPLPASMRWREFSLDQQPVAVLEQFEADRDLVIERWRPHEQHLNLREPFGRIREALEEAQRGATK